MNFVMLLVASVLAGCAVEAGNPTSKTPKGMINLQFLQTTNLTGEQLTLHLDGVYLRAQKSQAVLPVTLGKEDLNLYATDSSKTQTSAGKGEFPAGTYDRVVIKLPQRKPPRYRDSKGVESDVSIASLTDQAFYLEDNIVVEDGKTTTVLVNLDPIRSLSQNGDREFRFIPRGGLFGRRPPMKHEGETTVANAAYVCAYGYAIEKPPFPGGPMGPAGLRGPPPPPPREFGPMAKPPPIYESRDEIEFDNDVSCDHAFVKSPVNVGKLHVTASSPGELCAAFFPRRWDLCRPG